LTAIQKIVAENEKQRYKLSYESTTTGPGMVVSPGSEESNTSGIWWIRANQGHSVQVEALELEEIKFADDLPVAVHGTSAKAWELISKEGLSRMKRNHIHLATGLPSSGVKSGMRANSQVLIYINVVKAMSDGLVFQRSANGVILTEGDDKGFILPEYFVNVEFAERMGPKQPKGNSEPEP